VARNGSWIRSIPSPEVSKQKHTDEECALFRLAMSGDMAARNEVVERNLGLVGSVASYYARRNPIMDIQDMTQAGRIGLMRSAEKFDVDRGFRFSTYALFWIKQSVQRLVIDLHPSVVSASRKDVDSYIHGSMNEEEAALYEARCISYTPIDSVAPGTNGVLVYESIPSDDEDICDAAFHSIEASRLISVMREHIPAGRNRIILMMSHGLFGYKKLNNKEIGKMWGISAQMVGRIVDKCLVDLQKGYGVE